MKIFATLTAALLFTFMLASAPAFSQEGGDKPQAHDEKAKDKDARQDERKAKQDDNRAKPDDKAMRQDEGKRNEASPAMRQNDNERPAAARPRENNRQEQRPGEHADRDRDRQQHPVQAQRGKRIPEEHFRQSFGREHRFHVDRTRVVNVSQPVVVYGGYSFQLVDTWPAEWSYDDDCYIDYVDDGYYLFDAEHPGIRIAVYVAE
jgi:hypothetical protein